MRAKDQDLDFDRDPDGAIEELLEREISVPEIDADACRRYYEKNTEQFHTPVRVEVRHILLAAAPDDPERRLAVERQAEGLIRELQEAGTRFPELTGKSQSNSSSTIYFHLPPAKVVTVKYPVIAPAIAHIT